MIIEEVHRYTAAGHASDASGRGSIQAQKSPGTQGRGAAKPTAKRSMWPLYAILLMALAPVVAAVLAYFAPELGLRPEGHTNYGRLIEPQRPAPDADSLPLTELNGNAFDLQSLKGQWVLVSADTGACPESCVRKLFILRNSHASQGKNVDRISRVWFITDNSAIPTAVLDAYVGTRMLRADPTKLVPFLAGDQGSEEGLQAIREHMWIIDPLGNLMMEFPPDADPIKVRDDIIKLLKNSRIG